MIAANPRRRFYVSGQPVELWENPVAPFGWTQDDIEAYAAINDWELLFNALVLHAASDSSQTLGA